MKAALLIFVFGVSLPDERSVATDSNVGIYGGHSILIQQAPYMASLRFSFFEAGPWKHACGGSIIHERFVLTAGHCIHPLVKYKVLVGTANRNGTGGELVDIEQIYVHPKFNRAVMDYDFCVIQLKEPLNFSSNVAKLNLLQTDENLTRGTMLNATGWGSSQDEYLPEILRQVEIPLYEWVKCKKRFQFLAQRLPFAKIYPVTSRTICAGNGLNGRDACQGDSGGPLTLGDVQVGVTSWGFACGIYPGIFARVSSVQPWIMEKINMDSA